jgi:VanZ family protein
LRGARLFLASAAALVTILSAPFVSEIRFWIRSTFPGHFALVVGGLVAAALVGAVGAALLRIRNNRGPRFAAIGAALAFAAAYAAAISTSDVQANAVERFHFVEYGAIAFLFYRAFRPIEDGSILILPVLAGLIVGTCDEWFQWFIPVRVGEMRDVFLNLVAIGCGLLFSIAADPPPRLGLALRRGSGLRAGAAAGAVAVVFAAFVYTVHLGRPVSDASADTFMSRYDAATLTMLAGDRAVRWRAAAPIVRALSREDQYLSEGILHVQARNRLWTAGNYAAAWHENQILERYYDPVLDVTYPQRTGPPHRWPVVLRADTEQRARLQQANVARIHEGDLASGSSRISERAAAASAFSPSSEPAGYVSDADHGFMRTWPASVVWSISLAIATMCIAAGYAYDRSTSHS